MTDTTGINSHALPSSARLLRSTLIAAAVALALLVTAVLPAEYGIDPTGVGRVLGLTEMGKVKAQLAREAASSATTSPPIAADSVARATPRAAGATTPPAQAAAAAVAADSTRRDSVQVVHRPNEGKEIKLIMVKGARVNYSWTLDKGAVGFETHGDTLNAPRGVFHSYGKGRDSTYDKGSFVAVFNGMHGWFWRNRSSGTVTVTLRTDGQYSELKRMP